MKMENEILEFPETQEFEGSEQVLKEIRELKAVIKDLAAKIGGKEKKKEYPEYPYPKKMQEWLENPKKFEEFNAELEKEREEYKKRIEELENRIKDYEATELDKKIDQLLNYQEQKGLINSDMKATLKEDYAKKFSVEQIDTLLKNLESMDFSKVQSKSKKGEEMKAESKDFSAKRKEIEEQLRIFDEAGISGPARIFYEEQLKSLGD